MGGWRAAGSPHKGPSPLRAPTSTHLALAWCHQTCTCAVWHIVTDRDHHGAIYGHNTCSSTRAHAMGGLVQRVGSHTCLPCAINVLPTLIRSRTQTHIPKLCPTAPLSRIVLTARAAQPLAVRTCPPPHHSHASKRSLLGTARGPGRGAPGQCSCCSA